jgi:hypothetical protein
MILKTKARVLELIRAWPSSSDQITVCVDGWENVNFCYIVNVLASCNGKTVLLDYVSTGAESQKAEAQARTIEEVMVKNGGVEIFGGVPSDNTSSSVNARDILAEKTGARFFTGSEPRSRLVARGHRQVALVKRNN